MSRPIDKEFEDADDTGVLDISGRKLRQFPVVPGDLLDFSYIFEADLSSNRLDKLPKEVISFKALVKLSCYHNSIRWLPEELNLLPNLKEIDFGRNFLQKVPPEIFDMNLYAINLSNNRLVSIPANTGNLKNLQFLDLSCNCLTELPESFYTLQHLRHFNIHRNKLRDLSEDLCRLSELQYLDVSSNSLCRLPISLKDLEPLQVFIVDNNPLEYPPPQVCCRGLNHICKFLEVLEKRGSDQRLLSSQRDESLRRKKDRAQKKNSYSRPMSESTPVGNRGEKEMGLLDEMANLVNKTFGEKDGELTPTGTLHWSMAQYISGEKDALSSKSKEEYREAAYRLYMQQEGHPGKPCPSSPGASSLNETSLTPGPSLPKINSDENVYRSSTASAADLARPKTVGRSLSNEKFPRSGSWNSHMRIPSPVLPSKYVASDRASEEKNRKSPTEPPQGLSSKSATDLGAGSVEAPPTKQLPSLPKKSPKKAGKRPPPLDTTKHQSMSPASSPRRIQQLLPQPSSHETSV